GCSRSVGPPGTAGNTENLHFTGLFPLFPLFPVSTSTITAWFIMVLGRCLFPEERCLDGVEPDHALNPADAVPGQQPALLVQEEQVPLCQVTHDVLDCMPLQRLPRPFRRQQVQPLLLVPVPGQVADDLALVPAATEAGLVAE